MSTVKGNGSKTTSVCDAAPEAAKVFLAGNFNAWDPAARRMVRVRDGSFRAKLDLAPGEYQYKFVADGTWLHDPNAERHTTNEHGTLNSVVQIRGMPVRYGHPLHRLPTERHLRSTAGTSRQTFKYGRQSGLCNGCSLARRERGGRPVIIEPCGLSLDRQRSHHWGLRPVIGWSLAPCGSVIGA